VANGGVGSPSAEINDQLGPASSQRSCWLIPKATCQARQQRLPSSQTGWAPLSFSAGRPVDDDIAAQLADRFYMHLQPGADPHQALRLIRERFGGDTARVTSAAYQLFGLDKYGHRPHKLLTVDRQQIHTTDNPNYGHQQIGGALPLTASRSAVHERIHAGDVRRPAG
jgi:hypothetical protein